MIDTDKLTYEEYEAYKDLRNERDYVGEPSMWEIRDRAREIEDKNESRRSEMERILSEPERWEESYLADIKNKIEYEDEQKRSFYRWQGIRSSKRNNDSENNNTKSDTKSRISGLKALLLGTAATVIAGAAAITSSNSKKDNKDPEDSKNKKEVVIPADKKNVIEVEGDISDAQAVELVNKYKKEQAAKNGNTDQNQKGQTYYIVVKNSNKRGL